MFVLLICVRCRFTARRVFWSRTSTRLSELGHDMLGKTEMTKVLISVTGASVVGTWS